MAIVSSTIEFNPVTGEFFRLERKRTSLNPGPLAKLFQPSALTTLYPMLTPFDFAAHTNKGGMLIIHRFMELPFLTDFKLAEAEKGKVLAFPAYGSDPAAVRSDALQMRFVPQDDQLLWLVLDVTEGHCYLITQCVTTGKLYSCGLPNMYSNGTMCTGAAVLPTSDRIYKEGSMAYLSQWLIAWSTCEFNADLNNGTVERVCKFDVETKINVRDKNWRKWQHLMSPPPYLSAALSMVWAAITGNEVPK